MIATNLIPMLEQRFAGRGLRTDSPPAACATFPAIHPAVGDIQIFDDGDELTVVAGNFTHGHFSKYDDNLTVEQKEDEIVEDVLRFLEELFADQVVLWGSHQSSGGWYNRRDYTGLKKAMKEYVWSGPLIE